MIIGNGLIAKHIAIYDAENIVFFASGVSNSQEVAAAAYQREQDLVTKTLSENNEKLFVYFSTYSIDDPSMQAKPYILHKKNMENYVEKNAQQYLIIRTSNLIGETPNPHTIANYLREKVQSSEHFEVWNIKRNLLHINHLCSMTNSFISENNLNQTIYLVNPVAYSVLEIVACFEEILNKKANYNLVDKGANFDTPIELSQRLFTKIGISSIDYLAKNLNSTAKVNDI